MRWLLRTKEQQGLLKAIGTFSRLEAQVSSRLGLVDLEAAVCVRGHLDKAIATAEKASFSGKVGSGRSWRMPLRPHPTVEELSAIAC